MFKRFLVLALLVGLFAGAQLPSALACSGFPYFSLSDLPEMDLLVRATVLDVDDRGYNAIIRVEDYYKGEGSPFATVMRYKPALASGALVRGYDTSCTYAGRGHQWMEGSQGYFALRSNGDGTYSDSYGGSAHFYPVDGQIHFQEGATEGYALEFDDPQVIKEEAFVDLLLDAGERDEPLKPDTDTPFFYPLMRFLNITTEDGTRYQVNPDRSLSKLEDDAPLAISPDGSHVAFRLDDGQIAFQYVWTEYQYTDEEAEYYAEDNPFERYKVPGEAVRFSNDSNFAAVWGDENLTIYRLENDQSLGYGQGMSLYSIAEADINTAIDRVLWSADSSTLVWQDGDTIWRWNIFEEAEASQLNISDEVSPTLMDVSTYGRYVRVGESGDWLLIDSATGESYAEAVASPTEQYVVYVNQSGDETSGCSVPLNTDCKVFMDVYYEDWGDIEDVFPYQGNLLGLISCEKDACLVSSQSWHPSIGRTQYSGGRNLGTLITDLRQITYDSQYSQPALLVGDYEIYFDFYSSNSVAEYREYVDVVDLEDQLDSPIASIEWGQAVFFDEYALMTSQYLPR